MSIFYKNQGFKQSGTSKTIVLTCPTDGTIIVKSMSNPILTKKLTVI